MNVTGLSPSSIDAWEQCPRRWFHERIENRGGGTGQAALMGTFVHLLLERLMQLDPEERSMTTARALMVPTWAEFAGSDEWTGWVAETGFDDLLGFRRSAWASICGYFQIENPAGVAVESTERFLKATLEGVPVRGIVDRLEQGRAGVVVSDYKTGKVPAPMFRKGKDRQINLYAAMVEAVDGVRPVGGRLIFTSFAKVLDVPVNVDTVAAAVHTAVRVWDEVAECDTSGVWPERTGPLCGWCPFVAECEAGLAEVRDRMASGKLKASAPAWGLVGAATL